MADNLDQLPDEELTKLVMQKYGDGKPHDAPVSAPPSDGLEHLSDAELDARVKQKLGMAGLNKYDPMQALSDMLHGMGQGVTLGHLPQVTGAVKSGAVSGPDYEAEKLKARQSLDAARNRNPSLVFGGELAGGSAPAMVMPGLSGEGELATLKAALSSGVLGAAQNPGGDVDAPGALKARAKNALLGAAMGAGAGYLKDNAATMAEERAFKALGPYKRDVQLARQRGNLNSTGRDLLDQKVIKNMPASRQTLLDRVGATKEAAGQSKSAIIDELSALEEQFAKEFGSHPKDMMAAQQAALPPPAPGTAVSVSANPTPPTMPPGLPDPRAVVAQPGGKAGVDLDAIKTHLRDVLALNPDLPEAAGRTKRLEKFLGGVGQGESSLPLKRADKLKTDTGALVAWMRKNTNAIEPEKQAFNKELYAALNRGVDDAAEVLAKTYGSGATQEELKTSKRVYGNMAGAERMLDNRIAGETANRMVSPSDYGAGAGVGVGMLAHGSSAGVSAAASAAAAGVNQFLRKYGNQISAKQLDNLSKVLNSNALFRAGAGAQAATVGASDRRKTKLKALEE